MTKRIPHTPGPWKYDGDVSITAESINGELLNLDHLRWGSASEFAANAQLISKAPEMLELLEQFVRSAENQDHEELTRILVKTIILLERLYKPEES